MKNNLLLFLFSLFFLKTLCQDKTFTLSLPADFPKVVGSDFIFLLNHGTGKQWEENFNPTTKSGIQLKIGNNPKFQTKEAYHLKSDGISSLVITSSSNEGLIFGFYKHLRSMGYKFYLPDELYTIIPVVKNPFGPKKDDINKPLLQIRDFFGTGGFGTHNPDPDKSVETAWNKWKLRNGMGSAFQLGGHRGENFILENTDVLRKNPDWLASPLTNDPQKDQIIKLNYLNKEALNFFVDWTLKPFTSNSFKSSSSQSFRIRFH